MSGQGLSADRDGIGLHFGCEQNQGQIVREILETPKSFGICRWKFIRREGNEVAHFLANLRPSRYFVANSESDFPSGLIYLVDKDCAII